MTTPIELPKQKRNEAIASLQQYFDENMPEPLGDMPANLLLNFILEDIGPAIYNQAISDAATRMQQRAGDLEGELYHDEFQYWARLKAAKAKRR